MFEIAGLLIRRNHLFAFFYSYETGFIPSLVFAIN